MDSVFTSAVPADLTFQHLQSQFNTNNTNDGNSPAHQYQQNYADDNSSWSDISSSYISTPYDNVTFNTATAQPTQTHLEQQQHQQQILNKIQSSIHTVPSSLPNGRGTIQARASSRSIQRAVNSNPYSASVPGSPTDSASNSNTESVSVRSNSVTSENTTHTSNTLSTSMFIAKPRPGAPTLQELHRYASMIKDCKTSAERGSAKKILASSWLLRTYGNHSDSTVPRQALYNSYATMCAKLRVSPVRAASLGKIVIALFDDIRTRRLGTRGASKYHFTGIAPTSLSELHAIRKYACEHLGQTPSDIATAPLWSEEGDDELSGLDNQDMDHALGLASEQSDIIKQATISNPTDLFRMPQYISSDHLSLPSVLARNNRVKSSKPSSNKSELVMESPHSLSAEINQFSQPVPLVSAPPKGRNKNTSRSPSSSPDTQYTDTPLAPSLADPSGNISQHIWSKYSEHTHTLIESIRSFRVDRFEIEIRTYFSSMSTPQLATLRTHSVLPFLCLTADAKAYDKILTFLISATSSVPSLSAHNLSSIRQLALNLENIYILSLGELGEKYSKSFAEAKLEMAARFSHLLLRVLDLTDVSKALCVIFRSKSQCRDMLATYSGIQWEPIKKHLYLIAPSDKTIPISMLESELAQVLENIAESDVESSALELLSAFVKSVAHQFSSFVKHSSDHNNIYGDDSRTYLVQFSWILSQILRDLTLSSASTFGLFQVLKLWIEDMLATTILRQTCINHSRENLNLAVQNSNSNYNGLGDSIALMALDTGLSPTPDLNQPQILSFSNLPEVQQPTFDFYGSGSANFASQMPAPMMSSHALCAFDNYSSTSHSNRSSISVLDSSYLNFRTQECHTPGSSDLECPDMSNSNPGLSESCEGSDDTPQFLLAPPVGHFDTYPYQMDSRTPMPWSDLSGLRTAIPEPRRMDTFSPDAGNGENQANILTNIYNIEKEST